jgi:hypothetical protein
MKHIKLFENWLNEGFSPGDVEKLKAFAEEVSNEIQEEYVDQFDRRSTGLNSEDYSPEEMFNYIQEYAEDNKMTADEVIADFKWNELTQELGLENPFGR